MTKRLGLRLTAVAGLALAGLANTGHATLLWYDGFTTTPGGDYNTAADLATQSGGTGSFFSGAWVQHGGDTSPILPTSLSIPGQINPSVGGALGEPTATGTGRTSRVMTDQWGGFTDPAGTYYMSYLVNYGAMITPDPNSNNSEHRVMEMFNGASGGDSTRVFMLGYSHYAIGSNNDNLGLQVSGGPGAVYLDTNPATPEIETLSIDNDGRTHLMVLKFEMQVNDGDPNNGVEQDRISVFLDPAGTTEPALANAQVSVDNFNIDRIDPNAYFVFNGGASLRAPAVDEFRVSINDDGQGFANVANWTGVPEPTSLGLVLLGSLGLLAAGRKRV